MRLMGRGDCGGVVRPIFARTAEAQRAAGQRERDLDRMMRMEIGFLFGMADPDAAATPKHDPARTKWLHPSCASSVAHRLIPRGHRWGLMSAAPLSRAAATPH